MVSKQQKATQLLKLFESHYKAKHGVEYKGNRHADKWGFMDMYDDLGWERAIEVIEYYFKTSPRGGHDRKHLSYHYHEYSEAIENRNRDLEYRKKILNRMKENYEG